MIKKHYTIFFLLIISAVALIFYLITFRKVSIITPATSEHRLQVVTSFYPLYFFTTQIAQDKADVHNITPAGAEPHEYEPTPRDIAKIENSDLLIINGAKFEGWANNVMSVLNGEKIVVTSIHESFANQNIPKNIIESQDPHYWLDPVLAKEEVNIIAKSLISIDPTNSYYYNNNAQLLLRKLDDLDAAFKNGLNQCKKRDIVTSHSAFGHLTREYGLKQLSISGLSPDEEPATKKLIEVAKFAKDNDVNYIFFESLVNPKLADTIAHEIGAKTLVLNPLEGLTDSEIADGKNYFTVMHENLTNLKLALQCL